MNGNEIMVYKCEIIRIAGKYNVVLRVKHFKTKIP